MYKSNQEEDSEILVFQKWGVEAPFLGLRGDNGLSLSGVEQEIS